MTLPKAVLLAFSVVFLASPATTKAGSFSLVANCDTTGCAAGVPRVQDDACKPDCIVPPFAKTHPLGYDGTGGTLQIRICVADGSPELIGPTDRAIATWNQLTPATNNCYIPESVAPKGCVLWEDALPPISNFHAESVILHELGHCAMALDHPDRNWDVGGNGSYENTSFTRSYNAVWPGGVDAGDDLIRGSSDDFHTSPTGGAPAASVGWFRKEDNDPGIVDDIVIDSDTYTRSVTSPTGLPPGHTWGTNGNRKVTALTIGPLPGGFDTQAVMYSRTVSEQQYSSLSADEVNMVKMGMTGKDNLAGTVWDYTIELIRVASCAEPYDILVLKDTIVSGVAGDCRTPSVDYSYTQNPLLAHHFTLTTTDPDTEEDLFVVLNEDLDWDTDPPTVIFGDGFESDVFPWSAKVP